MAKIKGIKKHLASSQKLEVLRAIETSGNVSQACLQHEVSRASYYAWLRKHKENPHAGLTSKKRAPNNPNKTPQDIAGLVIDLAIRHPDDGCSKIAELLLKKGFSLSPPTVQKILNSNNLGTVSKRLYRLEKHHILDGWPVSDRLLEQIHRNDPCLRERYKIGSYPGEILVQDCFPIFQLIPGCYVHVAIDTYSSSAFAYPWFEKTPSIAIDVIKLLAFKGIRRDSYPIKKIYTSSAYMFTRHGKDYSAYLASRAIAHEIYSGNSRNWNGFIESYKKYFFHKYEPLKSEEMDPAKTTEVIRRMKSFAVYSATKVHGFPNFGMCPGDRVAPFRIT